MVNKDDKILIGGQKLRELGSDRHTDDFDYLVFDEALPLFSEHEGCDYVNAAKHGLYRKIWETQIVDGEITHTGLFAACSFAFACHLQNHNFEKADSKEYDLVFLSRKFGSEIDVDFLLPFFTAGEFGEIKKIYESKKG